MRPLKASSLGAPHGRGLICSSPQHVDVLLPDKVIQEYNFADILKKSICLEQSTQAWCENCEKYQPTVSSGSHKDAACLPCEYYQARFYFVCSFCLACPSQVQTRNIRCLPDVLVINCEVNSAKEAEFWKVQAEVTKHCDVFLILSVKVMSTQKLSCVFAPSQYAFNKAKQKEAMEPAKAKEPPPMPTEWCLE